MMDPDLDAKTIFYQFLEKEPADLGVFLSKVCGDNTELRKDVEGLIQCYNDSDTFFDSPIQLVKEQSQDQENENGLSPSTPSMSSRPMNDAWPEIPGYSIEGELGRGGMGIVYLARQLKASRLVALKVILGQTLASDNERRRFQIEAEAIAQLQHPGIVQIFEIGEDNGYPYFSLEYCSGGGLDQYLSGLPLISEEAAQLVNSLADAIQAAHDEQILHRDLKPANILLAPRSKVDSEVFKTHANEFRQPLSAYMVKLTDFSLAKKLNEVTLTETGQIMGTPCYIAPEQTQMDKQATVAVDIYGLGAILYECLTGRPPFRAATTFETMAQVVHQEPVSPRQFQPSVPKDLETICLKCLNKEPSKRYNSAQELSDDLQRYLSGKPIFARPISSLQRAWRWCKRNPIVASLLTLLILSLTIGIVGVSLAWQESTKHLENAVSQEQKATANAQRYQRELREKKDLLFSTQVARARSLVHLEPTRALKLLNDVDVCPIDESRPSWQFAARDAQPNLHTLTGHKGAIIDIQYSPDGRLIASAGEDGFVRLWDAQTGELKATLKNRLFPVHALVFSPDNATLISGGGSIPNRQGEIIWWDIRTQPTIIARKQIQGVISALALHPQGRSIASLGTKVDPTNGRWVSDVRLWDVQPGERRPKLQGKFGSGRGTRNLMNSGRITQFGECEIKFDESGTKLFTVQGYRAEVWDTRTGMQLWSSRMINELIRSGCFSPDGKFLVIGDDSGMMTFVDTSNWKLASQVKDNTVRTSIRALCFSPDGKRLAVTGSLCSIQIWDSSTQQLRRVLERHSQTVGALCFSPDGQRLVSGCGMIGDMKLYPRAIKVWDLREYDRAQTHTTGFTNDVQAAVLHPTKTILAIAGKKSNLTVIHFWDPIRLEKLGDLQSAENANALAFNPSGTLLAVGSPNSISLWNTKTRTKILSWRAQVSTLRAGESCDGPTLVFTPDGSRIASVFGKEVKLWDVNTGNLLTTLQPKVVSLTTIRFNPSGSLLATAGIGSTIQIWDTQTFKQIGELNGPRRHIRSLAFSPDGKRLAVTLNAGAIELWNVSQQRLIAQRNIPAKGLFFSPDGKNVIGYQSDQKIAFLSSATGILELILDSPMAGAYRLIQFTHDGRYLCSANHHGMITLWKVPHSPIHQ